VQHRRHQAEEKRLRFPDIDVFQPLPVHRQSPPQFGFQVGQVRVDSAVFVNGDPEVSATKFVDGDLVGRREVFAEVDLGVDADSLEILPQVFDNIGGHGRLVASNAIPGLSMGLLSPRPQALAQPRIADFALHQPGRGVGFQNPVLLARVANPVRRVTSDIADSLGDSSNLVEVMPANDRSKVTGLEWNSPRIPASSIVGELLVDEVPQEQDALGDALPLGDPQIVKVEVFRTPDRLPAFPWTWLPAPGFSG